MSWAFFGIAGATAGMLCLGYGFPQGDAKARESAAGFGVGFTFALSTIAAVWLRLCGY